jgi:hypothetical protein
MRLFEWRYGTLEEAAWRGFHPDDCEANIYGFNIAVPTGVVKGKPYEGERYTTYHHYTT